MPDMKRTDGERGLEAILADYGFAMGCLVQDKVEQTGREAEVRRLLAQGFRFIFSFEPDLAQARLVGEVSAALYHPETGATVPILRLSLTTRPRGVAGVRH